MGPPGPTSDVGLLHFPPLQEDPGARLEFERRSGPAFPSSCGPGSPDHKASGGPGEAHQTRDCKRLMEGLIEPLVVNLRLTERDTLLKMIPSVDSEGATI